MRAEVSNKYIYLIDSAFTARNWRLKDYMSQDKKDIDHEPD